MTELAISSYEMPAATLGPESPLAPLHLPANASASAAHFDAAIPPAYRKYFGYGAQSGILPYSLQNVYDRRRISRSFQVAVLENEILKATFLLDYGGRLWSLYHKPNRRELLHVNPVFQPANLAVRNAWFSGGIEWNAAIIGHSPLTCSPVFAGHIEDEDGTPALRLYEWDRLAGIPIQIDFFLPPQSPFLLSRVRLINPHARALPMYWWTNIAVPEQAATRVLAPADWALRHGTQGDWRRGDIPLEAGIDQTKPACFQKAADVYFAIPDGQRPWIAALDGAGTGLCHASTSRLKGRKLFVWGMNEAGRHWQEFLSTEGHPYIEIQAGLARTQYEYLPMPGGVQWSWLEAFGLMETDSHLVHGSDWPAAVNEVERRLNRLLPQERLEAELLRTEQIAGRPPKAILHRGSGWGALERLRREHSREPPFCDAALIFDNDTLAASQTPWYQLLTKGILPYPSAAEAPLSWMVHPKWRRRLESSLHRKGGAHWAAHLHQGLMGYHAGEFDAARRAWRQSVKLEPNAWALRNLAVLAHQRKCFEEAADLWLSALDLQPTLPELAVETIKALRNAQRNDTIAPLIARLPANARSHGRIRLLEAQAALAVNDLDTADMILRELEVSDLREGEVSLSEIWYDFQARRRAQHDQVPLDASLRARVRAECPPPYRLNLVS